MAKKKAELQDDCQKYHEIVANVRETHLQCRFTDAVEIAISSFDFVDGMIQFEKQYEKRSDRKNVECIDYVLQYAPLLLDSSSLDKVSVLLKSQKRIDKNTTTDETAALAKARELLWQAHRLWDHLERHTETLQDSLHSNLAGDQDRWDWFAEKWEQMGFIQRKPEPDTYRLLLVTRLDADVRGKCPSCGVTGKATKDRLLEQINCPKCRNDVQFVILASESC
jgi:hypothetical protein